MNTYPFTVFKRSNRPYYFVSYKDPNGKYLSPISTKQTDEKKAMQIAFEWLRDGIPKRNTVVKVSDLTLKDMVRKLKDGEEAETLLAELSRLGYVKTYVRNDTPEAVDFISFLTTFWDWETSLYIKEKLRKSHGIHKRHCSQQKRAISLYWEQFFNGRVLGEITAVDIDAFISYMGEKDLSPSRRNTVIKAGTKALRWAFSKGQIKQDPTRGHILYTGDEEEREILTPAVATAIFRLEWKDERAKIANMLAAVTGMRNGEIKALRFQDIGADCIYVRSSYNSEDKLKPTKNNKSRRVEIPFPILINGLIELAKQNPWGVSPESFIFWSTTRSKVPMQGNQFCSCLRDVLVKVGFSEEQAEKYDFHGWRHFFTAYMAGKLDKKLIKGETGHLTDIVFNRYADHHIVGDRELIQSKKLETFAGLLPEKPNVITFKNKTLAIANNTACG